MREKKVFSFQRKLYISYSIIILLFALFSILYWYSRFHTERQSNIENNIKLAAVQSSQSLNKFLSEVNGIFYLHNTNPIIRQGLKSSRSVYKSNAFIAENILLYLDKRILAIVYYDADGHRYSSVGQDLIFGNEPQYKTGAAKQNGSLCINESYTGQIGSVTSQILPISKELIDIQNGHFMGYVIVYVNFWQLCEMIGPQLDSSYGTIVSDGHKVLYTSQNNYRFYEEMFESDSSESFRNEILQQGAAYSKISLDSEHYTIYGLRNDHFHWNILKILPNNNILLDIFPLSFPFLGLTALTLAVLLFISYLLSQKFSRGINNLYNALAYTTNNHLEPLPEEDFPHDEIGELSKMFNSMINKLSKSIKREYIAKIYARDMQLSMLSYQINPHFLNNCLNTISSMAMLRDAPEIVRVSRNLGKLFQYNLQGDNFVTIKEELENTRNYCALQYARFPDRFEVVYHSNPGLESALCLKFLLQPIVENSFSHGFKSMVSLKRKQNIDITITENEKNIFITVTDNGRGIPPQKLEALRKKLSIQTDSTELPQTTIGLWNVNQRIKAYFGSDYGIEIDSEPNLFTCVQVKIPLLVMQEDLKS